MQIGDKIPLFYQTADYTIDQYVKAWVTDSNGNPVSGSPVNLSVRDSSGLYANTSLLMPNSPWVHAKYAAFSDSGYTELSTTEGGADDTIFLDGAGPSPFPSFSNVIAIVDGDFCNALPLQDVIVQGSDRTLAVRLITDGQGNPFDLTDWTIVEFRFRNEDGTVLSISTDDVGPPVQVVSETAGSLTCLLTADQTELLATMVPSPFTIVVTKNSGVTVINAPTQVGVVEPEV